MNILKEIRQLKAEGKLHGKLINRTRMLFGISIIMFFFVIYNVIFRGANIFLVTGLGIMGFVLGVFVFSKMNVVNWDEEKEVLVSGKMDLLGFGTLGLYILFEIAFRTFLKDYFPQTAVPLLLAGICGTIFGRGVGTIIEMHRVYKLNHEK